MTREVKLVIPALSDYVAVARLAVSGIAARMQFTIDEIEDIKIALSEACTNVVKHAYDDVDNAGNIVINCKIVGKRLEIKVEDDGQGFSPQEIKADQPSERSIEKLGLGLGLTFIKSLMDESDVESEPGKGSRITMVKTAS